MDTAGRGRRPGSRGGAPTASPHTACRWRCRTLRCCAATSRAHAWQARCARFRRATCLVCSFFVGVRVRQSAPRGRPTPLGTPRRWGVTHDHLTRGLAPPLALGTCALGRGSSRAGRLFEGLCWQCNLAPCPRETLELVHRSRLAARPVSGVVHQAAVKGHSVQAVERSHGAA